MAEQQRNLQFDGQVADRLGAHAQSRPREAVDHDRHVSLGRIHRAHTIDEIVTISRVELLDARYRLAARIFCTILTTSGWAEVERLALLAIRGPSRLVG